MNKTLRPETFLLLGFKAVCHGENTFFVSQQGEVVMFKDEVPVVMKMCNVLEHPMVRYNGKYVSLAKLVYMAFGEYDASKAVKHRDKNPMNCCFDNLYQLGEEI